MNLSELAPEYIRDIAPYQPGKPTSELARELGLNPADIIKLASNENPLGVSPKALAAMQRLLPELALYPDGNGFELKAVIAQKFSVQHDNIVLGNGSNDILELAARTFLTAGESAVYAQHAFAVYPLVVKAMGARGIEVPAKNFGHDLEAMLAAIEPNTKLLFIANPNNPTGTFIDPAVLRAALARVPARVLVLIDEAYTEYLPPHLRADTAGWIRGMPNLIVSRTFSKAYGLAGLRVGYGLGNAEVIGLMNRVRQPFNVNQLALTAAAAALNDAEFLARGFNTNQRGMAQMIAGFKQLGLGYIPSFGNFVCVKVAVGENSAGPIFQKLLKQGVIVRPIASYGMPEYLRISIGTEAENARFLKALAQALHD
ncbi:MAG TPA: histidinol-phosphate transaminase [Usitatibacteraceae bacterium]